MTDIVQEPAEIESDPTNEQVVRMLEQKHDLVRDAWKNLRDAEESSMQTDWVFEHFCTVLSHAKRLFQDEFDKLLQEAVDLEREGYFKDE